MDIYPISREEVDCYKSTPLPASESLIEEVEWFADERRSVVGVVAHDYEDDDWSFMILHRDEQGVFRAVDVRVSINERDVARVLLLKEMAKRRV